MAGILTLKNVGIQVRIQGFLGNGFKSTTMFFNTHLKKKIPMNLLSVLENEERTPLAHCTLVGWCPWCPGAVSVRTSTGCPAPPPGLNTNHQTHGPQYAARLVVYFGIRSIRYTLSGLSAVRQKSYDNSKEKVAV